MFFIVAPDANRAQSTRSRLDQNSRLRPTLNEALQIVLQDAGAPYERMAVDIKLVPARFRDYATLHILAAQCFLIDLADAGLSNFLDQYHAVGHRPLR